MKETSKRFRNIILTGMPGSGKSTFAKTYALYSDRYFLDFDKYFETVTKKKVSDVFLKEGEDAFRLLEEKVLRKLEKKHNYVIAMGGGTLCHADNFEFARKLGLIVYLSASPETIAHRIYQDHSLKKAVRPMFVGLKNNEDILLKVNELWDLRKDFYEKAYIHLNTDFGSIDNLKLQLGLYEKKSAQREQYKEKIQPKYPKKPFMAQKT